MKGHCANVTYLQSDGHPELLIIHDASFLTSYDVLHYFYVAD